MTKANVAMSCHVCKTGTLKAVEGYERFPQVTSDCKIWRGKNRLCVCPSCGSVQKMMSPAWKKSAEKIYSAYTIYHQSNGVEQAVFDKHSGAAFTRSGRILEFVIKKMKLAQSGRYLDIGCGNGGALRSVSALLPGWSLAGTELNDHYADKIKSISKDAVLYTCPLKEIRGKFGLITMFHVLEHIADPVAMLAEVRDKLSDEGILVVDIPDYRQNPFDLFVADHCTHFSLLTISDVMGRAGFDTIVVDDKLVPKETVTIAKKTGKAAGAAGMSGIKADPRGSIAPYLVWADSFLEKADKLSREGDLGIFGTSIAATWLLSRVGGRVKFFVDEDPARCGKSYMGLPIYHPGDIPKGSSVFLALPSNVAEGIRKRLPARGVKFHLPPPYPRSVGS